MSLSGPKGPTEAQKRLIKMQEEDALKQKSELAERKVSTRKRAGGRSSLFSGPETGAR